MKKESIMILTQLAKSLEETELNLEEYYEKKDHENFNKSKKLILQIQNKLKEIIT